MSRNNLLACSTCNATFNDKIALAIHHSSHNQFQVQAFLAGNSGHWDPYAPSLPSPLTAQALALPLTEGMERRERARKYNLQSLGRHRS
jgi:hypothetical protein